MNGCTRDHRVQEIGCYVVYDDGTVFVVYAPCSHGISEVSALYHPRLDCEIAAADVGAPAGGEGLGNVN